MFYTSQVSLTLSRYMHQVSHTSAQSMLLMSVVSKVDFMQMTGQKAFDLWKKSYGKRNGVTNNSM